MSQPNVQTFTYFSWFWHGAMSPHLVLPRIPIPEHLRSKLFRGEAFIFPGKDKEGAVAWLGRPRRKSGDLSLSLSLFVSLPICLSLLLSLTYTFIFRGFRYLQFLSISASQCNESACSLLISPIQAKFSVNYLSSTSFPTFKNSQPLFSAVTFVFFFFFKFITSSI